MPKAPKYVGSKKGINRGSLLYANEERLFWVRFSETALITASGLPFYISLLAYFPFFYHCYLVNLIPVGSFSELIDLFCESLMENWSKYMCGLVLNFHGFQWVLSYGVVISKYELNFSFRLLLDSCGRPCMDQYPLIHLKWWLHVGQLLQWKYWVSVLLIQEMHFLCHHLTTRGNFVSLALLIHFCSWFDFKVMNWLRHFVFAVGIGT